VNVPGVSGLPYPCQANAMIFAAEHVKVGIGVVAFAIFGIAVAFERSRKLAESHSQDRYAAGTSHEFGPVRAKTSARVPSVGWLAIRLLRIAI
jgi:hypothetical protein